MAWIVQGGVAVVFIPHKIAEVSRTQQPPPPAPLLRPVLKLLRVVLRSLRRRC